MRLLLALAALASVLLFDGCAKSLEQAIVGRYHGDADLKNLKPILKPKEKEILLTLRGVIIEIKDDGKATVTAGGNSIPSTWKLEKTRLTISPEAGGEGRQLEVVEGGNRLNNLPSADDESRVGPIKVWFKKE